MPPPGVDDEDKEAVLPDADAEFVVADAAGLDGDDAILAPNVESLLHAFLALPAATLSLAGRLLADGYSGYPDGISVLLHWADALSPTPFTQVFLPAVENALHTHEPALVTLQPSPHLYYPSHLPSASPVAAVVRSSRWRRFFSAVAARHPTSNLANSLLCETLLADLSIPSAVITDPLVCAHDIERVIRHLAIHPTDPDALKRLQVLSAHDEPPLRVILALLARLVNLASSTHAVNFFQSLIHYIRKHVLHILRTVRPRGLLLSADVDDRGLHAFVLAAAVEADAVADDLLVRRPLLDDVLSVALSHVDGPGGNGAAALDHQADLVVSVFANLVAVVSVRDDPIASTALIPEMFRVDPITFVEKAVLIRAVCLDPVVLALFDAAFSVHRRPTPSDKLSWKKRRALCILLAYAAVFLKAEQRVDVDQLKDKTNAREIAHEVGLLFDRIEMLVTTCETQGPGTLRFKLKKDAIVRLTDAAKDPFLARGVCIWASECLRGGDNLRDLFNTAQVHLAFLGVIATHHPHLRDDVLSALVKALTRDYSGLADTEIGNLHHMYMLVLIGLVEVGMGLQVTKVVVEEIVDNMQVDVSKIRLYLLETFKLVGPPYSKEFVTKILELVRHPRLKASAKSDDEFSTLVKQIQVKARSMGIS